MLIFSVKLAKKERKISDQSAFRRRWPAYGGKIRLESAIFGDFSERKSLLMTEKSDRPLSGCQAVCSCGC